MATIPLASRAALVMLASPAEMLAKQSKAAFSIPVCLLLLFRRDPVERSGAHAGIGNFLRLFSKIYG